jgi:hypothetical protein
MSKHIPGKAEVVLEYPDKFYMGTFERSARYDAHFEENGVSLTLWRTADGGDQKTVHIHLHYALFADILAELAKTASAAAPNDVAHRNALRNSASALCGSLGAHLGLKAKRIHKRNRPGHRDVNDLSKLTPEEEVLLLHVLE